ncbi:MAG: TonB-dependent receptor [Bacteroidota bacterium]
MKNKLFTISFLLLLCSASLGAYSNRKINVNIKKITGVVYDDANGAPLIGASIVVKGTDFGTTTDFEGAFEIEVEEGAMLIFSYTGYDAQEVEVGSANRYEVRLKEGVALEEITVIGSRGKPRTDVERPVPIDVVDFKELQATGQTDLGQMVQFSSPSFNSAKYGVNGTTNYADPASLRGMGPDQSLVTVNGKRRHQFSTLNLNVAPGLGNVVTDLNSIPSGAVKRMEVLRDGAAAQYGSDAIAGIINIALKDQANGGTFSTTAGFHSTSPDDDASAGRTFRDGATFKNSLNYGFGLGKEGSFFNFTLEHFSFAGTNRSDFYSGTIYPSVPEDQPRDAEGNIIPTEDYPYLTDDPRGERNVYAQEDFVVGNYGSNENETKQLFVNMKYPLNNKGLSLYAFGGYSDKDIVAYGFFRNPARFSRAVLTVFPDGYVPVLPGQSEDYSYAVGLQQKSQNGWNFDLSYTLGHNDLELFNQNSTNPSLGSATPTSFYVGQYWFEQNIINADVSKNLGAVGSMAGLNLAFGAQYRTDRYQQFLGSPESFEVGPLAASKGKDVGSSARPGIQDENDISRSNFGVYADVEADISEALLIAAAVRFENYSDFGGNISGKLAARYKLTDQFSVRGSYNRGFRAPSVAQLGTVNNTSTVQNGQIVITRQVPAADARLAQLGIEDPKAEISDNFNLGLTAKFVQGAFLVTVDAFQITIDERIVISERLRTDRYPAVAALFPDEREIRFFTNHVDTKTQGIDVVASYKKTFTESSRLNISLAATFTETEVTGQKDTPQEILAGAAQENQGLKLLGLTATELIEVAVPRNKLLLSALYSFGRWGISARATRFGNVQAFSRGLSGEDENVTCNESGSRCVQTFEPKVVTDLSLSYDFNDDFTITLGSNNIFDVYPDKYNTTRNGFKGSASSYAAGQIPYSRNSNQFGFNGRYLYLTGTINF